MRGKTPKHDGERMTRTALRRDKDFKNQLAGAWGVEEVPQALRDKVEKTIGELPEELVVKVRPMQTFLRGVGTAVFCCVCLFVVLFMVNFSQPQFTESLPGLGGVFREINRRWYEYLETLPTPESTPAPTPQNSASPSPSPAPPEQSVLAEDNGVKLTSAEYHDGELIVTGQVPYMGRVSEYLMDSFSLDSFSRFGTFAIFQPENGSLIPTSGMVNEITVFNSDQGSPLVDACSELSTETADVKWYIDSPDRDFPELVKQGVLTLYEGSAWFGWARGSPGEYAGMRVIAQFAVDLSDEDKPNIYPVTHYRDLGLRKITPEECLDTQRAVFPDSGWVAGQLDVVSRSALNLYSPPNYDTYYKIVVYGQEPAYRSLALNCYYGEDLVTTMHNDRELFPMERGEELEDHTFLDEYLGVRGWFAADNSYWTEWNTPKSRTGNSYRRVVFAVPSAVYQIQEGLENARALLSQADMMRFELVDAVTGEVLIPDINADLSRRSDDILRDWSHICTPAVSPSPQPSPYPEVSALESAVETETE